MIYLFVGLASSGILARVYLLAHRGGFLLEDASRETLTRIIFEFAGTVFGLIGFVVAFLLFAWWVPILAFVVGYWVVPVFIVKRLTFPLLYNIRFLFTLTSAACSILLISIFFDI